MSKSAKKHVSLRRNVRVERGIMDTDISRRSFLISAGTVGAGLAATLSGCGVNPDGDTSVNSAGIDGVYNATALGFAGQIDVTTTIQNGKIVDYQVDGPFETPDRGGKAIGSIVPRVIEAGSIDGVDTVSGATVTSKAVLRATEDCLEQAGLLEAVGETRMKPGIYVGEGRGFDWIEPVRVKIEVDETTLKSVEVIEKGLNREEPLLLKTAENFLIPRIIENQSVDIDTITGATGVSNGIEAATEDALKKALVAGGSTSRTVNNFHVTLANDKKSETLTYDVVVCGLGGAGSATAMSVAENMKAANRDISILAVETAGKYGGTASNAGTPFGINAPNTLALNNGELWCEYDSLLEDWLSNYSVGTPCKEECVRLIMDESGNTIDWLQDEHGFVFTRPQSFFGSNPAWKCGYNYVYKSNMEKDIDYASRYPNYAFTNRSSSVGQYYDRIINDFVNAGGEYLLETTATELLYDKGTNKVTGIKAVNDAADIEYTINAKAVVLCTGGFGGSADMVTKYLDNEYYPNQNQSWKLWGMAQNKGLMIESAIEQGVGTYNIDMPICTHFKTTASYLTEYPCYYRDGVEERMQEQNVWSLNDVPMILGFDKNTVQVGVDGKRHFNETSMFDFWMGGPVYYTIHGSDYIDDLAENGFPGEPGTYISSTRVFGQGGYPNAKPIPQIYEVLESAANEGTAFIADSLEELADKIGVPTDEFVAQVERYQSYCESGIDEEFSKSEQNLLKRLQYGPYYAVKCNPTPYATVAALDVDTNINVLLNDGKTAVGGLYACGNDSGGVIYSNAKAYVSYGGAALGWALTSGRLAGKHVVEYLETL